MARLRAGQGEGSSLPAGVYGSGADAPKARPDMAMQANVAQVRTGLAGSAMSDPPCFQPYHPARLAFGPAGSEPAIRRRFSLNL